MSLIKSKKRVADHGEVFTRLLILPHKPSQHVTRKVYTFLPTQAWTKPLTDADLYAKYGLNVEEVAFIEKLRSDLFGEVSVDEGENE